MLSSFFSHNDTFCHIAQTLPRRSSFSGLANSSAKLALLSHLLASQKTSHVLFVAHEESEAQEFSALAPLFLSPEEWEIHTLPSKIGRDEARVEWMLLLAQKSKKRHFFIMSEAEAIAEKFPQMQVLAQEKLLLKKGEKQEILPLFNQLIEMGFEVSPDVSLQKGQYRRSGDIIDIFPIGSKYPFKIEFEFDEIKDIWTFDPQNKKQIASFSRATIFPAQLPQGKNYFYEILGKEGVLVGDDISDLPGDFLSTTEMQTITFTPFPEGEETGHYQMRFLSVLKFYHLTDLLSDFRSKLSNDFHIIVLSKRQEELQNIFLEEKIPFSTEEDGGSKAITLLDATDSEITPPSFQNPDQKILFLTDREIFQLRRSRKQKSLEKLNLEFLTSLKVGDYVVHLDHGIGHFLGVTDHEIDGHKKEYLEIAYAKEDRLFVPVDQADKVSRFLCEEGSEPKLTRLGSVEWENAQKKVRKEAEEIAKELLKLYAERERARKKAFIGDTPTQKEFEKTFPYEETPGQIAAISDVKKDMESSRPMDRLVCGDVGFGKTEIAIRAAFKAVQSGRQVALIAPVTILAQQHFEGFVKRMKPFDVRLEVLSRFRTPAEQKEILKQLKKGTIDIVIGTHRLLQKDVEFHNLGLLIIDEEQRFGVKQKERMKEMRKNVDILTMTATPIPRTLNLALNKLRDISTITTPPPGRLPIITEVRKYSDHLIRDAILKELKRGGQIYFLHNRVQTIESIAEKLRKLVPEASFVVGHGQLPPHDLEQRIVAFKEGKYDVLISSTIIENGIDLPNANTMMVMNAERFGLSQLYQLRGRIGRGKRQAYAYFLYQTQKLSTEAKKRLRAIVEASELGSGFQIAMRDLEIRGSGDVLGVNQSGTVNAVGVSHFLRMLHETIRKMKEGEKIKEGDEIQDVTIDLPVDAYIPSFYIADSKEKILAYQNLAALKNADEMKELEDDFQEEYGQIPKELRTLLRIIELKILAKKARVTGIRSISTGKTEREIQMILGKGLTAGHIMNLLGKQEKWMFASDKLKIDLKNLGMDFLGELKKALVFLGGK